MCELTVTRLGNLVQMLLDENRALESTSCRFLRLSVLVPLVWLSDPFLLYTDEHLSK